VSDAKRNAIEIVFETHSTTEDNQAGRATGWLPGKLSPVGREQAAALGARRRGDGLAAVFTSDLGRAVETASIAFRGSDVPVLHDWRLRECDYGDRNGMPAAELDRAGHVGTPYPGGESWTEAVARAVRFLDDLPLRWRGKRVLVIGHTATRWALDHALRGASVTDLVSAQFDWQAGWEYLLDR
jgi:alpha-ribazole phosphatase/probable phosphoglycerate mutase